MAKRPKKGPPRAKLTSRQIAQIQVDTGCSEKTIRLWARGEPVKGATDERIRKAIGRLGLLPGEVAS